MIKNANTDLYAGIFGLLITAVFWTSIDPEVSHLSIMFPRALVVILGVIAATLVVKGLVRPQRGDLFSEGHNERWIITAVLFFLWVTAIGYIGFWVSTVAGMSAIVYYLSRSTRRVSPPTMLGWVGIVAVEVTIFYLIFTRLLEVPLPGGFLF